MAIHLFCFVQNICGFSKKIVLSKCFENWEKQKNRCVWNELRQRVELNNPGRWVYRDWAQQCHYRPIIWGREVKQAARRRKGKKRERDLKESPKFRGLSQVGWPVGLSVEVFFFFFFPLFFPCFVASLSRRLDVWCSPPHLSSHPKLLTTGALHLSKRRRRE